MEKEWTNEPWDKIVSAFIDDIVIYTENNLQKHEDAVWRVMAALQYAGLKIAASKSSIAVTEFKLLGININTEENTLTMDDRKAQELMEHKTPASLSDIQIFLAICNYWSRFLIRFREIAYPLSRQLRTKTFEWGEIEQRSFEHIIELIKMRITITLPDYTKPFHCFTDTAFWACASMLTQTDNKGTIKIIGVASKLFNTTEARYTRHHKDSLGLAIACKQWAPFIHSSAEPVSIYTNVEAINYWYRNRQFSAKFRIASNHLSQFLTNPGMKIQCTRGKHQLLAYMHSQNTSRG